MCVSVSTPSAIHLRKKPFSIPERALYRSIRRSPIVFIYMYVYKHTYAVEEEEGAAGETCRRLYSNRREEKWSSGFATQSIRALSSF